MTAATISLALVNANVLTVDPGQPLAEAVAISRDRIVAVGSNCDVLRLASSRTRIIDCQGQTLLPGFNDAHCHLPGLARRMLDLDCSPRFAPSIAKLQALVRERTASLAPGTWLRGFGYDDLQLAERRHPHRRDLDAAAPYHPAWIEHRSGHASVLNSRALELAGIHRGTPDPSGGVIERDPETGEPTGVLLEMHSFLRHNLGALRSQGDFDTGMRAAGQLLNHCGITSVQDAGASNGVERWQTFRRMQSDGALSCRVTMFAGIAQLNELLADGFAYASGDSWLKLGHAKIVLTMTSGSLHPSYVDLEQTIADAHRMGFPVAIHCVEEQAIAAAASALRANTLYGMKDRIEHCSEGTPPMIQAVRESGAAVVTQPGFVYHSGTVYRENVEARLLPHLYPAGALQRAGVTVAFGSDAPVIDPNPWPAIYSAVTRRASDGRPLTRNERRDQGVSVADALRAYTLGSAEAEGTSDRKGSISPGKLADLVLVDADPLEIDHDRLPDVKAALTIVGGSIVWEKETGAS